MFTKLSAFALALAAAAPVFADQTVMTRPIEAGVLATEDLNLVAYYTPAAQDGLLEVTATWAATDGGEPRRLVMGLQDGDQVSFSLPGHMDTRFTFSREEEVVRITATPVVARFEAASL